MDQPILRIYACEGELPHESGAIDRTGGQLTGLRCQFIVRNIPEVTRLVKSV